MMTTEIREKFYGRFVQNAPLTRGDIELPVAMHDVREVSALSIFIFFFFMITIVFCSLSFYCWCCLFFLHLPP